MNAERNKRFAGVTENLNKVLSKSLQNFAYNTQWTGINEWLISLESVLREYPSPFIAEKILLSKRLNQCMNPILPEKIRQTVLRIHEILFTNMRLSVEGNMNDYVKLFAEDLGVYSVSILPYLTHSSVIEHRLMILRIINKYYLDLERELIPMLPGLLKSILPVYVETFDTHLITLIEHTLKRILEVSGRRYVIATTWSLILKYKDCKVGGLKFLSHVIDKMEYIKGEEEFSQSGGFSELERQILEEEEKGEIVNNVERSNVVLDQFGIPVLTSSEENIKARLRKSHQDVLVHLNEQDENSPIKIHLIEEEPKSAENLFSPINAIKENEAQIHEFKLKQLGPIIEEIAEQSIRDPSHAQKIEDNKNKEEEKKNQKKNQEKTDKEQNQMYQSQSPFFGSSFQLEPSLKNEVVLDKIPRTVTPGISLIKQGIDENCVENNYPHAHTLVISAIISCLEQDEPIIKRSSLDFIFSHLRIKSQILNQNDKIVLVEALIRLFKKKEISIIKRVNRWIFGKEDDQNRYAINQKNQYVIKYIIHAFKKILETVPTDQENCSTPLKILQNFYIQHPNLVPFTLNEISLNILRYIFNYGSLSKAGEEKLFSFSEQILKLGKRFLENMPSYYNIIFESLGKTFIDGIQEQNDHKSFECIKYIDFSYIHLMKHQHGPEELVYLTTTLEYLTGGLSLLTKRPSLYTIFMKDSVLLILNLISRRESVLKFSRKEQEKINQKYFEETGLMELPVQRIQYQEELLREECSQEEQYVQIIEKLQIFFNKLGYIVRNLVNIQQYEETFKLASLAIVKIQQFLPKQQQLMTAANLPKWFATIEGGIKVSNPLVSLSAIEAMIKCLMWENKHPIYQNFKNIIMQQKINKIGNDYQKLALEKLWSLLDFPHMHSKIIDLIVAFSKYFPYEFTQTVKRSFNTHSAPDKEASIQRFSHFWRLTGYKYKDLLTTNKEFVELNKVGLFRMLDFLDDQNPLVRHAAKNWLMESMTLLTRVIEPLLHELGIGCSEWYETPKGIFLIQNVYDTNNIFSTFRRIRSILSNGSYTFLRYVYSAQISDNLDEMRQKVTSQTAKLLTIDDDDAQNVENLHQSQIYEREPVLPKAYENLQVEAKKAKMSYLDFLIILAIKYIEGHAIQSMGVEFYIGNSGVNASAVQLIETLLDYIDHPLLCEKLINYIMEYLFKVLNQVIINKEYIMQIQLINLLRNIFFNSSFRKKADIAKVRSFFMKVFTNNMFLSSVLNGLHTPFAYVRSQFINFITVCIPLIADFLEPTECTDCIRHILYTYYKIIKDIGITLSKTVLNDDEDEMEEEILNFKDNMSMSKILELQIKIKLEQKFIKFSDNLSQVGKTNQILSVLHGVQSILNYFYDLNKINVKELNFEFSNPYTYFDTFKKIITLGLSNSEKNAKLVQNKNFLHNYETCEALLKDLQPVYETILRSWPLSQEFVRIGSEEFSSIGMRSFNFDNFNKYNKVVKELIEYVEVEKESIWGKIFCIMQPMFCKFPKEIIDIYLKIWIRECSDLKSEMKKLKPEHDKTELLMKIMETIIVNNFPINVVVHAFLESSAIEDLTNYYQSNQTNVLSYQINKNESKLLYFIYVYFNYIYLNEKELTKEPLLEIWSLILKCLKPFEKSKNPLVAIWILEIIYLCSKKYSPKELLYIEKFKADLHLLVNTKLKYIANVASKKEAFFYEEPIINKISFKNALKSEENAAQEEKYHVVLPLPPSLYELFRQKKKEKNNSDLETFKEYPAGELPSIEKRYRLYCFKILKKMGLQILQNIYLPQKAHWVVIRSVEWIDLILPVIEDKTINNMLYAQCASEIVFNILEKARILFLKDLKPKLLAIFNKDDFFICNTNILNYWASIINWIIDVDKNNQTYSEYVNKVSLNSSYFTSENSENKKRIKSFERICFILYSGSKDKYANKIKGLIEKIADVIKKPESAHAALLILILFSIRILILRLSQISLNQLFIDIWPMILTLLMQTFSKQLVRVQIHNEISKNPNYLLSALKLVEMISLTNLGQFAHHQWIFVYDYFGLKLKVPELSSEMIQHYAKRPELASIIETDNKEQQSPFLYRPFLLNYIPQSSIYFVPEHDEEEEAGLEYIPEKRKIIIKDSFIKDQTQLKLNALLLLQYLVKLNQIRTEINWREIEDVIVNDFINLDNFIHQIS